MSKMKAEHQIYIRLLDGTETLVPVKADYINSKLFKIIENQYLDIEEDITSVWEFFPGDVVECENLDGVWVAKRLINSTIPDRNLHKLIFLIVESLGEIQLAELQGMQDEVKQLCERQNIPQMKHPLVQVWIKKYCEGMPSADNKPIS